jgi:hypothetical protein
MNLLETAAKFRVQLIMAGAAVAVLAIAFGATYNVAYNKGLNVSKVAIESYQGQVNELRGKLTKAQGRVTTVIQTEYLDRVVERERIVYQNRDVIVTQVPEQYILSQGWIYAHNQAANGQEINPSLASNTLPSTITDRIALNLVADNYGNVCRANADQLTSLQAWIRQQKEVNEEVNSNR